MNSSHQTRYMYSSAKSVVLKHCSAITDWGMDIWVKDIGGNFFLIRHITWADLDGFIISICARTPSLCPPLCSSFLCLLLSFTHEMSHSQPSLTHICLLLVTSSFPNFSHSTSFRQHLLLLVVSLLELFISLLLPGLWCCLTKWDSAFMNNSAFLSLSKMGDMGRVKRGSLDPYKQVTKSCYCICGLSWVPLVRVGVVTVSFPCNGTFPFW